MFVRSRRPAWVFAVLLGLAACGGGGGGDTPAPPVATAHTLSGTISVAPTAAVDSDSNDVTQAAQGNYRVNDTPATAQAIGSPVLLAGTVNQPNTWPTGNNISNLGDTDDMFAVDLVAGQVVELEFAADPAQSDVDLYVASDDAVHQGASTGSDTRYECVQVSANGRYFIDVFAFRGATIYTLKIGAPGSATACAASTTAVPFTPGQLLAKARRVDAQRLQTIGTQLSIAGIGGAVLATKESATPVPHLLQLPANALERSAGLQVLAGATRAKALAAAAVAPLAARSPVTDILDTLKYAKRLQASGAFEYVQPNWIAERSALVGTFPPNDRAYAYQRWHYEQINLPAAMSRIAGLATQPSQRPIVAVIDDGVVLDHPDLAPQLYSPGRAFISRSTQGDGNLPSGDNISQAGDQPVFHGTHVAGTVGAATFDGVGGAGTAPMALILPLRVFPPSGGAGSVDVINAMLYAARLSNNSGLLPARRADVINMSLGSDRPCDAAYQDAITQVRAAGVIVVVAAGNSGHNDRGQRAAVGSPANCSGAVAVSALDARKQITPYSNTGTQIGVAAPGGDASQSTTGTGAPDNVYSDVASFDAAGNRQPAFGGMQGTSMASPHVAGVMALMRYVNPGLTVTQVDVLLAAGALTDDLGSAGRDIDFGFGLINAGKAVDAALNAGSNPPPPQVGVVVATPSSLDFGSFQSSAALDLVATATTAETVLSVSSDNAAVTVAATNINATTKLGRYTVNVNRAALAAGSYFPKLTVSIAPARSFTVQLSITQPGAGGSAAAGDYGPIYVLLIDPATQNVLSTTVAQRANGRYTWSTSGVTLARVSVVAGGDLDNDDLICQRGEPCGAYPVFAPGRDLSVIDLSGDRNDINVQVAPLSGMSVLGATGQPQPVWRRRSAAAIAAGAAR